MNAMYKGWDGVSRVEGRVGELTMPVDTGDQVVCTVGQTDGHSSSDKPYRSAMGQNWTPSYPINPSRVSQGLL